MDNTEYLKRRTNEILREKLKYGAVEGNAVAGMGMRKKRVAKKKAGIIVGGEHKKMQKCICGASEYNAGISVGGKRKKKAGIAVGGKKKACAGGNNAWIMHVKKYAKDHDMTYGEALKNAGASY